ncbi:hypothetical protein P691DRAFT_804571 [Macrolepiota fuliginosa MF-IS2]|uniref:Uncharacterized protein n=1 Tax=Macrolepiota fuliginosa MF-IS2 TaxID=1400762 RepID=A0A9P5XMU5_9AGAR|nr:hypothetical protein P691DRAFT_804571 [Macrolepiota fuliginosa MF-IS2]
MWSRHPEWNNKPRVDHDLGYFNMGHHKHRISTNPSLLVFSSAATPIASCVDPSSRSADTKIRMIYPGMSAASSDSQRASNFQATNEPGVTPPNPQNPNDPPRVNGCKQLGTTRLHKQGLCVAKKLRNERKAQAYDRRAYDKRRQLRWNP